MKIFGERRLTEILDAQMQRMQGEIRSEPPNKLLNANESDYVRYLAEKFQITPLEFGFDSLQASYQEKMIPLEDHPFNSGARFSHFRKEAYPRQVITFHLPFAGDRGLLSCRPSSYLAGAEVEIEINGNEITFDLVNWQNDTDALKREQAQMVDYIRKLNQNVTNDVSHFNAQLENQARQFVSARKSQHLQQLSAVESLGIPMRKASGVPQTFAVPVAPKKLAVKPVASNAAYSPQPTLDLATYQSILSIIHDTGIAMERHPRANRHSRLYQERGYDNGRGWPSDMS